MRSSHEHTNSIVLRGRAQGGNLDCGSERGGGGASLRSLPPSDLERVAEELANLPQIPPELTLQVLEEYKQMMAARGTVIIGGRDVAVRLLVKAFGENGAEKMVQRLNSPKDNGPLNFDALQKTEPQQVARFLAGEHAQTKALVVGHLEPKQASSLLMKLEPETRVDCVKRMATMSQFSSGGCGKGFAGAQSAFWFGGEQSKRADTGFKNLADLMNRLDPTAAREILETIEADRAELAISIRDLMFTFENFLDVPEPDMRELMHDGRQEDAGDRTEGSQRRIASPHLSDHVVAAVEMMKEDSEMMGPVRSKEVAKAQSEMIAIARKLEAEGRIVLKSEGEDEYVV